MRQVRGHLDDRPVPFAGMPGQQRRLALLEKGGVKRFASQRGKERTTDSVPFFNEVQMKGKTEKNIEELSIGLKNDYLCGRVGGAIPTRQGRHSKFQAVKSPINSRERRPMLTFCFCYQRGAKHPIDMKTSVGYCFFDPFRGRCLAIPTV